MLYQVMHLIYLLSLKPQDGKCIYGYATVEQLWATAAKNNSLCAATQV